MAIFCVILHITDNGTWHETAIILCIIMWTRNTSNYWIGIVISGKKLLQLLNSHTFCSVQIYFYYFYVNEVGTLFIALGGLMNLVLILEAGFAAPKGEV